MATDATGTPTSLGIPTYNINVDAPSGNGFNAAMAEIDTLIGARAPLASPAFTGTPLAPTPASATDNTTKIATTAWVNNFAATLGYLTTTAAAATYLTITNAAATYAPLASPSLTGVPLSVTPATGDNSTKIATTAFVKAQGYLTANAVTSVAGKTGAVTLAAADVSNAADKSSGSAQVFTSDVVAPRNLSGAYQHSVSYSGAVGTLVPDAENGDYQTFSITQTGITATTVTISAPSNPPSSSESQRLTIALKTISNASGLTYSWAGAYHFGSFASPGTAGGVGHALVMEFQWDGAVWVALGNYNDITGGNG